MLLPTIIITNSVALKHTTTSDIATRVAAALAEGAGTYENITLVPSFGKAGSDRTLPSV